MLQVFTSCACKLRTLTYACRRLGFWERIHAARPFFVLNPLDLPAEPANFSFRIKGPDVPGNLNMKVEGRMGLILDCLVQAPLQPLRHMCHFALGRRGLKEVLELARRRCCNAARSLLAIFMTLFCKKPDLPKQVLRVYCHRFNPAELRS